MTEDSDRFHAPRYGGDSGIDAKFERRLFMLERREMAKEMRTFFCTGGGKAHCAGAPGSGKSTDDADAVEDHVNEIFDITMPTHAQSEGASNFEDMLAERWLEPRVEYRHYKAREWPACPMCDEYNPATPRDCNGRQVGEEGDPCHGCKRLLCSLPDIEIEKFSKFPRCTADDISRKPLQLAWMLVDYTQGDADEILGQVRENASSFTTKDDLRRENELRKALADGIIKDEEKAEQLRAELGTDPVLSDEERVEQIAREGIQRFEGAAVAEKRLREEMEEIERRYQPLIDAWAARNWRDMPPEIEAAMDAIRKAKKQHHGAELDATRGHYNLVVTHDRDGNSHLRLACKFYTTSGEDAQCAAWNWGIPARGRSRHRTGTIT